MIFIAFFVLQISYSALGFNDADSYIVNGSSERDINAGDGNCYKITNSTGSRAFVSLKTAAEAAQSIGALPLNVSSAPCGPGFGCGTSDGANMCVGFPSGTGACTG